MNGTLLKQSQILKDQDTIISVAEYRAGAYIIKVFNPESTETLRVIKL